MQHMVERPFTGGGVEHQRGEVVDTGAWRPTNLKALVKQRFVSPFTGKATTCPCGRSWNGEIPVHPCAAPAKKGGK